MTWFRFYVEALDDPKVQRLPAKLFKDWVNLLCLSKRFNGTLPPIKDISYALRTTEKRVETIIKTLCDYNLLDHTDDGFAPHNWNGRQYKSDVSTERVQRFRERRETFQKPLHETHQNRTEQNRTDRGAKTPPPSGNGRGKRIPPDWSASPKLGEWAETNFPQINRKIEEEKFKDHWAASNDRNAVKRDWNAAFRSWCRKAEEFRIERGKNDGGEWPPSSGAAI